MPESNGCPRKENLGQSLAGRSLIAKSASKEQSLSKYVANNSRWRYHTRTGSAYVYCRIIQKVTQ